MADSTDTAEALDKVCPGPYNPGAMKNQGAIDAYNAKQRELARPRMRRVADLVARGLHPSEIAAILGVTRERARQLMEKAKEYFGKANGHKD